MDELIHPKKFSAQHIRDLFIVGLLLPLWGPLFLICAAAIKLTDVSAPIIYKQPRTGKDGRIFIMLKFRTMVPNADELKESLRQQSIVCWPDFKLVKDPRITALGKLMRKTSLDEIPQILNIIRGDMTFIGPRPTSFHPSTYKPWQTKRLDVVPGLTGMWQVTGRGKTEFDERVRIDIRYMRSKTWLSDISILLRTFQTLFNGQ